MTNKERENIIQNAIKQYNNSTSKESILSAVNMMENTYIAYSKWNVNGIEELRKIIIEAKEKYNIK
ncbi:MAG: hypothetical protein WCY38_04800 [Endomicrobiia bacterium]|jgi:hypothetical protein